jgi:hypothetical protein
MGHATCAERNATEQNRFQWLPFARPTLRKFRQNVMVLDGRCYPCIDSSNISSALIPVK